MILLFRPTGYLYLPSLPSLKYSFITLYYFLLVRCALPTIFLCKRKTTSSLLFGNKGPSTRNAITISMYLHVTTNRSNGGLQSELSFDACLKLRAIRPGLRNEPKDTLDVCFFKDS